MSIDDELPDVDYDVPTEEIHGGHGAAALERANWHLRHIAAIDRRAAIDAQVYVTERDRIDRWDTARQSRWASMRAWHEKPCVDLLAAIRATDQKTKTLSLPAGTIKSRTSSTPRWTIVDPDALYEWARTHRPDLIRPATRVLVGDLRSYAQTTLVGRMVVDVDSGEVVPGVRVEIPETTYSIETVGDDFA